MEHIRVNLTNFLVIGFSSALFLTVFLFSLVWLDEHSIPVLSPAAHAMLQLTAHFPKGA